MTQSYIKKAIEKAYKNGFGRGDYYEVKSWLAGDYIDGDAISWLLDPLFWQALGKGMGWGKCPKNCGIEGCAENPDWLYRWHRLIDHLAEGKDIESYFANLK